LSIGDCGGRDPLRPGEAAAHLAVADAVAEEAKGAGLLSPEAIEDLLHSKLASDRLKRLQLARDRLSARPEEVMTQEEIDAEIKAYRQEQRIAAGS
jgi:hypothetical protein